MRQTWWRWTPAIVAPIVIASGALMATSASGAELPDKTPEQVLALATSSSVTAFSGTVQADASLGLPDISALSGGAGGERVGGDLGSALDLLTGTHTARVYVDGPSKVRLQIMDTLAERDVVRNGRSVWLYDSARESATHLMLPNRTLPNRRGAAPDGPRTPGDFETPAVLAQNLLADLDASTAVTLGDSVDVAGRAAYDLVLTPTNAGTLIGSVSIAVDGSTGMPLRVQVRARGAHDPAISLGFTSLDLSTPSSDLFAFTPPKGTDVTRHALMAPSATGTAPPTQQSPIVVGQGWATIVELPAGSVPAGALKNTMLAQATTPVAGGRLFGTSLVNVLVTDNGRVLAGAVPVSALQTAAAAG